VYIKCEGTLLSRDFFLGENSPNDKFSRLAKISAFVTLQFTRPMTQKSLNLVKALRKYWKMFDDKYMFGDG
jgi:hypothetical protein